MVKTFRGILADGGVDRIRLSTKKGKIGYRIVKLQLFPHDIDGSSSMEDLIQVWKTLAAADAATADCDFSLNGFPIIYFLNRSYK